MMPILDENLIFLSQVKNAKLYVAGSGDEQIYVVHLWGTPYQMGLAHGQLVGNRLTNMVNVIWTYMENQIVSYRKIALDFYFGLIFLLDLI
jgi:isopenicillin-N N-acyltransferase-like protein